MSETTGFPGDALPDFDLERRLDHHEVDRFCREVLWPSVDYFWRRGNFLKTAKPGESFDHFMDVALEAGGGIFRLNIGANCDLEVDVEDPEGEPVISKAIHLKIEKK